MLSLSLSLHIVLSLSPPPLTRSLVRASVALRCSVHHVGWRMLRAAALSLLPWRGTHLSHPPQLSTLTEEDEPERQQQEEEDEDEGSGVSAGVQPDPMFQQTVYLLEGPEDMVSSGGLKSPDWVYESYYRMTQQHPLIVFLLLIVMGACVALLTVFFASGLVRLCYLSTYYSFCIFLS